MSQKLIQLIIQELGALNYHPHGDKRILIHCPFHNDSNPSLVIPLNHQKYHPGQFKCFSCGTKGSWNKLAERLRLKKWEDNSKIYYDNSSSQYEEEDAFRDLMFEAKRIGNETADTRKLNGIEELPLDFSWRGVDRDFWVENDFSYYYDKRKDEFYLYMPVTMNGEYLGYTLAAMSPSEKNPKYQTFAPTEKALLMYDSLISNSTIIIVEGHFDSWRLKYFGFNVCAMIGTENWSDYKTNAILAKCPKRVIVMTDGDQAGYKAGEKLSGILNEYVETFWYKFPIYEKPHSIDPGNMGDIYIEDLKKYII